MKTKGKRAKVITTSDLKGPSTQGSILRTSITLTPRSYEMAVKMAEEDGFLSFSGWVTHLLAVEYERRMARDSQVRSRGGLSEDDGPIDQ